ncbi:MAG: protein kinase [Clostridia bacterium]|nr:protein kinase [Clostridia bacterium]
MDTIFDGKYKIIKKIGSGGMSEVYLAEIISDGALRAIKKVPKRNARSFDLLAEPTILKRLDHPALPKIVDVVQDKDNLYIIEDYIDGKVLSDQLDGHRCFDELTVVEWSKQLCDVLIYLHNQHPPIIYRDMKPSNIIISSDGRISLIDFGIAREYEAGSNSDSFGTRGYAAPEQYKLSQSDPRTDIYSLGATMFHTLTGISPAERKKESDTLRKLKPGLSEGIEYIVKKCMSEKPSQRYGSAIELKYQLEHVYDSSGKNKLLSIRKNGKKIVKVFLMIIFAAIIAEGIRMISTKTEDAGNAGTDRAAMDLYEFNNGAENEGDSYLETADQFNKQGQYDLCIQYLTANKDKPDDDAEKARYMYLMGTAYFGQSDYGEASEYLSNAVDLEPYNELYMRDAAVACARNGDEKKASSILKELKKISGVDASTYYIAGHIYEERSDYENAIENYKIALAETTEYTLKQNSLRGLAEAYVKSGSYSEAEAAYEELIDMQCRLPHIYINLAIVYHAQKKWDSEEKILSDLEKLYPEYYQGHILRTYMYISKEDEKPEDLRDYAAAKESFKKAEEYAPEDSEDIKSLRKIVEGL